MELKLKYLLTIILICTYLLSVQTCFKALFSSNQAALPTTKIIPTSNHGVSTTINIKIKTKYNDDSSEIILKTTTVNDFSSGSGENSDTESYDTY